MKKYLKPLVLLVFFLQWVYFLLFATVFSKQPKRITALIKNDSPTVFEDTENYFTELSDFAVQGEYLYVLYDSAAVLAIYTLGGEYLRSYAFPWYQNGSGELLVTDDGLWLIDRNTNRWLFRDGLFAEASQGNEYSEYLRLKKQAKNQQSARCAADGTRYIRKGPSIYRQSAGSTDVIVARPFYDMLMQGFFPLIQHGAVLLIVFGWLVYEKRRQ